MRLYDLLTSKRASVTEKWLQLIIDTYPADSTDFLKNQKDPFTNPVGSTITSETGAIYDALLRGDAPDKVMPSLDNIIRIRAVQSFSPAEAVMFVFLLKKAVADELAAEINTEQLACELLEYYNKIDCLALAAFNIYTKCREQLHEIRVREIKARSEMALEALARATPGDN